MDDDEYQQRMMNGRAGMKKRVQLARSSSKVVDSGISHLPFPFSVALSMILRLVTQFSQQRELVSVAARCHLIRSMGRTVWLSHSLHLDR